MLITNGLGVTVVLELLIQVLVESKISYIYFLFN